MSRLGTVRKAGSFHSRQRKSIITVLHGCTPLESYECRRSKAPPTTGRTKACEINVLDNKAVPERVTWLLDRGLRPDLIIGMAHCPLRLDVISNTVEAQLYAIRRSLPITVEQSRGFDSADI